MSLCQNMDLFILLLTNLRGQGLHPVHNIERLVVLNLMPTLSAKWREHYKNLKKADIGWNCWLREILLKKVNLSLYEKKPTN